MMVRLEDMRVFAKVAEAESFTRAAAQLGMPKQTVSRRVAALEGSLGAQLLHRTTRRLRLTEAGAEYAVRCAEIVRLAEAANGAVGDPGGSPTGVLRVTADPVFAEAFLPKLVAEYATTHGDVQVDVVLTRRRVDLVQEGFDAAFRVGVSEDPGLVIHRLGAARIRYCASPEYIALRGAPAAPRDLGDHDCVALASDGGAARWPFRSPRGIQMIAVEGRARVSDFALVRAFVAAGMGIGNFPAFACADDVANGRLVPVLDDWVPDTGYVSLVHPRSRYPAARVQDFVKLTRLRFAQAPWV